MAASAARRIPWTPLAVAAATLAALIGAAALWVTAAGPAGVPSTPVELGPALSMVGALLLWRRPRNRIAELIAGAGVLFAIATLAAAVLDHAAREGGQAGIAAYPALLVCWLAAALPVPWMLLVLWFPDGRFTSARWRRLFVLATAVAVAIAASGYLFAPAGQVPAIISGGRVPAGLHGPLGSAGHHYLITLANLLAVLPLVALPALVLRFRRADVVVRQQIRWLFAAAVVTIGGSLVAAALGQTQGVASTFGTVLAVTVQPLPALAIMVAVLRYRLFDIDVLLSRAAVYGVLWAGLSVLLLLPALASGYLIGGAGALTAVGAALVVTLAFLPVRRRMQQAIESRMFGQRRRAAQELARIGESLRSLIDLTELGPRMADTLRAGLSVAWAGVWVFVRAGDAGALRPVGCAGIATGPLLLLPDETVRELLARTTPWSAEDLPPVLRDALSGTVGAAIPLVARGELVGLLACGLRPGEPLTQHELESLARFAGECALGLRSLRLETELRVRITEVETQAGELQASRQRLSAAQDHERRRIERNLHDGVQQQLVSLAVAARGLAERVEPALHGDCERLAADAEDAVFALQDLARGIFPSVLTDQGLPAALRAHAGRHRLPVHVEIAPSLARRRYPPEIEAALYFVCLEALTNIAKHAPDADASVALSTTHDHRELVLEVRDDGPGLPRRLTNPGAGLANMRDRIGAVGGALSIDSRPGAGTWIHASIPLDATVVALHADEADSRR